MALKALGRTLLVMVLLFVPPVLGAYVSGQPLATVFRYPPPPPETTPPAFSWAAFWGVALFVILALLPFLIRGLTVPRPVRRRPSLRYAFPWWGWVGLLLLGLTWILAWNRFLWFADLQRHTFVPLWLGFILVVNGLTYCRSGHCMLRNRPLFLISLFPVSAAFWWFFEFLNRLIHNWVYLEVDVFSAGEYIVFSTLSFATVLPAVLSTAELLATFEPLRRLFGSFRPFGLTHAPPVAALLLAIFTLYLAALSVYPHYLFPLVWIAPLFIIVSVQVLTGQRNVISFMAKGNWNPVGLPALAALVCGFFWELWNFRSLAHWEYAIPFLDRFYLFHMPALGFAGYLPFGIECMAFASLVLPSALQGFQRLPEEGASPTLHQRRAPSPHG